MTPQEMIAYFRSTFLGGHNISLTSVLACDPSYTVQAVCLALAAVSMEVVIYAIAKLVGLCLQRLDRITGNILAEWIDGLKSTDFSPLCIDKFNKWCKKEGKIDFVIEPTEWSPLDESVDKYMAIESNWKAWTSCVINFQANEVAKGMQHMVSGGFALFAIMTDDREAFLTFARWSILLEAGYEASDTFKNVLIPLVDSTSDFGAPLEIFHHVALYFFLPINRILLISTIGRDLITVTFVFTFMVGPVAIIGMVKNSIDISTPIGKITRITLQFLSSFTNISTRGPYWIYIAYRMLTTLWKDGASWLLFLSFASVCFLFSFFNLTICIFCYKGMHSTLKKLKNPMIAVDKTTESNISRQSMIKKTSIVIDALAQEVNVGRNLRCV